MPLTPKFLALFRKKEKAVTEATIMANELRKCVENIPQEIYSDQGAVECRGFLFHLRFLLENCKLHTEECAEDMEETDKMRKYEEVMEDEPMLEVKRDSTENQMSNMIDMINKQNIISCEKGKPAIVLFAANIEYLFNFIIDSDKHQPCFLFMKENAGTIFEHCQDKKNLSLFFQQMESPFQNPCATLKLTGNQAAGFSHQSDESTYSRLQ